MTGSTTHATVFPFFVITTPGLEEITHAELGGLGIQGALEPGGVTCAGGLSELYTANLRLRTASRLLVRVAEFRAKSFFELERHARKIAWDRYLAPGRHVRWRVTCRKSRLYHQGAVEQRFREAVDRSVGSLEPDRDGDEEGEGADEQLFVVRFLHDVCTVSVDSSGALLHRRGYRRATAKAPLRETLAAAGLLGSRWSGDTPLLDPLCGSGTIPIEGALLARRIAPGLATRGHEPREYAFQHWPEFRPEPWHAAVDAARAEILPRSSVAILASDRDRGAIEAAHGNAERAGVLEDIELRVAPLSEPWPGHSPGLLLTNPPYGVRVGEADRVRDLYAALGRLARERLPGWDIAIYSPDRALERQLRIPLEQILSTRTGGIPIRVLKGRIADEAERPYSTTSPS